MGIGDKMETIIDWLIRNQSVVFISIGIFLSIPLLIVIYIKTKYGEKL